MKAHHSYRFRRPIFTAHRGRDRERQKEREREGDRDKQRQRDRERARDREIEREGERERWRESQSQRHQKALNPVRPCPLNSKVDSNPQVCSIWPHLLI